MIIYIYEAVTDTARTVCGAGTAMVGRPSVCLSVCLIIRIFVWVQIAAATVSGNSHGQTVHTHRASVHQAAKLVAAL